MAVTIYDIAEQAGVSSSTVARALSGDYKGQRKKSRERAHSIQQIAQEMGYRPNARARALSEGRTRDVALLYTDDAWLFEGVNNQVVQCLVTELRKYDHFLTLVPIDEEGDWEDIVLNGRVDGCLSFQPLAGAIRNELQRFNVPCVMLGDDSDEELSQVVVDDFGGAYAAVLHLTSLGHKRLGMFVHKSVKPHCSIGHRQRGFEEAVRQKGLVPQFWHSSEEEIVDALLQPLSRPTGLLCYSDLESTLIVHSMWKYGINIPNELSVIGFNDLFSTKHMTPPLTTVAFDAHQIGVFAADILLSQIHNRDLPRRSEIIKTKLLVRSSTAMARAWKLATTV
jgi:LacI family transcriptional regulator, galactose operon repressor